MVRNAGFEPAHLVWKTSMLAADINLVWFPEEDLHLHCTGFESVASAVGLPGIPLSRRIFIVTQLRD